MAFITNALNFPNLTAKTAPVGADLLMIADSAASNALKNVTNTNLFANAPAITTPSITFNPTTQGVVGTTTNNNAAAGYVGEFVSSQILFASAISISTGTPTNVTSISLTAGDWDVWGNILLIPTGASNNVLGGISTTSATMPNTSLIYIRQNTNTSAAAQGFPVPYQRVSLSGTTTVYLVAQISFSTGACTVCGGINARRAR